MFKPLYEAVFSIKNVNNRNENKHGTNTEEISIDELYTIKGWKEQVESNAARARTLRTLLHRQME